MLTFGHKKFKDNMDIIKKEKSIEFYRTKCMKCTKCVQKCNAIGICHLSMKGEGKERYLDFSTENPCVNCGQCTLVCPFGSMVEQSYVEDVEKLLNDPTKVKIVQYAPSVRASINEIFKMEHNINVEKKINSCLRVMGFDKVFDVNFGADITSIIEAEELLERLEKNENLPMFTSCCPSWVNFVKRYKPELIPNLTTSMSPHIHAGMAYKTWWAEKNNIDPKNIVVVSVMPCTSKKDENFVYNGMNAVDYSLTVREFGKLIKNKNIDFANIEESEADQLGEYSGGAVIYGKSGGVMESALRVVKKKLEGITLENVVFNDVSFEDISFREANVSVADKNIKIAIIHTPKNVRKFIESGKYKEYQYVEVMNCNSGCINGGGQPLLPPKPNAEVELIEKRKNILNDLDRNKKDKRNALDNLNVKEYLSWSSDKDFKKNLFYAKFN